MDYLDWRAERLAFWTWFGSAVGGALAAIGMVNQPPSPATWDHGFIEVAAFVMGAAAVGAYVAFMLARKVHIALWEGTISNERALHRIDHDAERRHR